MNQTKLFNDGWTFAKTAYQAEQLIPESHHFKKVEIPHDWLIYDTKNLYENSIGWYKKTYRHNPENKRTALHFDGVYMDSTLYVNQQKVGEWKYGYSAFEHDISDFLHIGDNELLLKVVYQSPNSRWYSGAGIYRNVHLITAGKDYFKADDIYISPKRVVENNWEVTVEAMLNEDSQLQLKHSILNQNFELVSTKIHTPSDQSTIKITIDQPLLWSVDAPNLYFLKTELIDTENKVIQEHQQAFGFRELEFTTNDGFYLNGKYLKLNGVCEHHDLGALGAAFNTDLMRYRLYLLKEMGVNAIRTAHNMPAKELMELTDELGFLVITEAFDMWRRPKTQFDYARFFDEWVEKDVASWVKRDRNHPSVIMWSIGNEIYDTHMSTDAIETVQLLIKLVERYDYLGNAAVTFGSNYLPWENTQLAADQIKLVGYNYGEKYYNAHHEKYPDWTIYGSETASIVQSRGIYHFPYQQSFLADDDEQCSSLGNSATSWGLKSFEDGILGEIKHTFSLGQFIWTGFDYIGEPTPYHTKNSYFGQLDTAGFPKDSYYMYQAAWTSYKEKPMIHLLPYWDFNVGQIIDVRIASNAPFVELFLNGESLGKREIDWLSKENMIPTWQVKYIPGVIKAVAYDENMQIIAEDSQESFSDAVTLVATPNKTAMKADGKEIVIIDVEAKDQDNRPVKNANNRIHVEVTGVARLVGIDNGDSTDYDQFKGKSKRLFSGKLRLFIQATHQTGPIHVLISSPQLDSIKIDLQSQEDVSNGVIVADKYFDSSTDRLIENGTADEIPIRKLEIITKDNRLKFTPEQAELPVSVKIHPENASYNDIQWRLIEDTGADSNLASIQANGKEAVIKALGDGSFRLRCMTTNGSEKAKLISELNLTVEGVGKKYKDPYQLISGSLYDSTQGEVSNGNERGFATARDGITRVSFHEIDFGKVGSNEITLPIFALSDEPYQIEIWQGVPNEPDSLLLADVVYQKPSRWNVYQEETYTLNKVLQGIQTISIQAFAKIHVKGLLFKEKINGFDYQPIINYDHLYGDSFQLLDNEIEKIGNNVSIVFEDFNFGDQSAKQIIINGRSRNEYNTIIVLFESEGRDEVRQNIEFAESSIDQSLTFDLQALSGKGRLSFIFLPGSNFDFSSFQFFE